MVQSLSRIGYLFRISNILKSLKITRKKSKVKIKKKPRRRIRISKLSKSWNMISNSYVKKRETYSHCIIQQREHSQAVDSEGPYRLLHCCSKGGKAGVIQVLDKGVEANLVDYDMRTALHLASCEGCTEIVILLLEKGAYVKCQHA